MNLSGINFLPYSLGANAVLALAVAILTWRLIDARSDVKEEIGRCNADKLQSTLEAERLTNNEQRAAQARRTVQLASELERTKSAKSLLEGAALKREQTLEVALAAIRNPARNDDANNCLDRYIPDGRISGLRGP